MDSEVIKPNRGHKKKTETKINETEDNDKRDKRERLVACVLSGNSRHYLGKEYTEQQINEIDCNNVNTLLNRYESVLSAQMTKSLSKRITSYLECDPFLNTAMQRFTCDLYCHFGTLLAPVSIGKITGKHCAENSVTKLNDKSNNRTCDQAKSKNCNETEEPSEN